MQFLGQTIGGVNSGPILLVSRINDGITVVTGIALSFTGHVVPNHPLIMH